MARMFPVMVLVLVLGGCESGFRSTAPTDLSDRLARLEGQRLSVPSTDTDSDEDVVHANTPPPIIEQLDVTQAIGIAPSRGAESSGGLDILTLSDIGAPQDSQPSGAGKLELKSAYASSTERKCHEPPLPNFFDTVARDVKEMPCDLWRDTKRVYANPVNLAILGAAYGGSLALQESGPDSTIEHHFNRNNDFRAPRHEFKKSWRDAFAVAGNPGTHFALAGAWYLLGQTTCDDKTYEVGKTLFSALLINGATVVLGQTATWDKAPNGEWGTFPSGHTSSAFVVASVLHEAYGHVVGIPLYGLASLVAVERLDDREHYFSDVAMGAVLGTVIGHAVASGRDPEFFGWKVLPYAGPDSGAGIAFMKSLE